MKFCQRCGTMDQGKNLRAQHYRDCQPHLSDEETGFLRNGELPERHAEDFRMVLKLMGMSEKSQKPRRGPKPGQKRNKEAAQFLTPPSESDEDLECSEEVASGNLSGGFDIYTPGGPDFFVNTKDEPAIYSQESFGDVSSKCRQDTQSTHKSKSERQKSEQRVPKESTLPTNAKVQKLWNVAKAQGRRCQQRFANSQKSKSSGGDVEPNRVGDKRRPSQSKMQASKMERKELQMNQSVSSRASQLE